MYLVIQKCGKVLYEIHDIHLLNGLTPCIGSYSPVNQQDGNPQIEPALWFKVELIQALYIDVSERNVSIMFNEIEDKTGANDDNEISVLPWRNMTISDYYDFECDIDEMFELASLITQTNKEKHKNWHTNVINLIHCHLLPLIRLEPDDILHVEMYRDKHEKFVTELNEIIESKCKDIATFKKAIEQKKAGLIRELQDPRVSQKYPYKLLHLLAAMLQEDVEEERSKLNRSQDEVNRVKDILVDGNEETEALLEEKRTHRNSCYEHLVTLLTARENIVCFIKKKLIKKHKNKSSEEIKPDYAMFMDIVDSVAKKRSERGALNRKKDFLLSVRVAIIETIQSLKEGKATIGVMRNRRRTHRATDVLSYSVIPDNWHTLAEKVGFIFNTKTHQITRKHTDYIKRIKSRCSSFLETYHAMKDPEVKPECAYNATNLSRRRQSFRVELKTLLNDNQNSDIIAKSQNALVSFRGSSNSILTLDLELEDIVKDTVSDDDWGSMRNHDTMKTDLKQLQDIIHAQFDVIVSELQVVVNTISHTAYYKLWLCYEAYFYCSVMPDIVKLFGVCYAQVCSNLRSCSSITYEDLGLRGDSWILNLIQDAINSTSPLCTRREHSFLNQSLKGSPQKYDESVGARYPSITAGYNLGKPIESWEPNTQDIEKIKETLLQIGSTITDELSANIWSINFSDTIPLYRNLQQQESANDAPFDPLIHVGAMSPIREDLPTIIVDNREEDGTEQRDSFVFDKLSLPVKRSKRFRSIFKEALRYLESSLVEYTPMRKLECITACIKSVQATINMLQLEDNNSIMPLCCDDLLTIMPLIILHLDDELIAKLYPEVVMLIDYMAPFLSSGIHANSLTHIYSSYHFIFTILLKKENNIKIPVL